MELPRIILRNENFVWRIIDGEAILMSPYGRRLHALNEVGTFIWELADGSKSIDKIIERICKEYEVERSIAQKDVRAFAEKLLAINALIPGS